MTYPSLNPWAYKPWWCQPWSIALAGILLIGGGWLLSQRFWITAIIAVPVTTWMVYFLLVWPKLMQQILEQTVISDEVTGNQTIVSSPPPNTSPDRSQSDLKTS